MVERREYESYIQNTIKETLSKISTKKWALIISARNYANFEYREENFVDGIKKIIIANNDGVDPLTLDKGKNVSRKLNIILKEIFESITLSSKKEFTLLDIEQFVETIMIELLDLNFKKTVTLQDEIKDYIKDFINHYYNSKEKIDLDRAAFDTQLKAIFNQPHLNSSIILEKVKMLIMEHFECTKEEAENLADIVTDINFKGYKLPFIDIRTKQNIDNLNLEEKTKEYLREYIDSGRYIKYINDKTRLYSNNNVHNLKIEFEKIIELHPDYSQEKIVTDMKKALEEGTNSVLYSSNNGNDRKMIKEDLNLIVSLFLRQKNNNNLSEMDIIKQLSVSGITADITTYINSKNKLLAKKSKDDPTKYTMPDQTKNKTVMKDLNQRRESIETALIPSGLIEDYNYKIEEKTYRTEKYRRYISKQKEKIDRIKLVTDGRIITPDQEEAVKEESLNKIIEEIVHKSANQPLRIIKYPDLGLFQINGVFVPKELIEHIQTSFHYNLEKSMKNTYIFLSEYKNIYFDEDSNKYLLPNQDIHIFGLPKGEDGLIEIISKIREYSSKPEVRTQISNLKNSLNKKLKSLNIEKFPLEIQSYLSTSIDSANTKTLEQQAIDNDRLQSIVSASIIPKTLEEKYELMTYFLDYNYIFGFLSPQEITTSFMNVHLNLILDLYRTYFGDEFSKTKNSAAYKNAFSKVKEMFGDEQKVNSIRIKYNRLFELQTVLGMKHQLLAYEIITKEPRKNSPLSEEEATQETELCEKLTEKFGSKTMNLHLEEDDNTYRIFESTESNTVLFEITRNNNEYVIKSNNLVVCKIIDEEPIKVLEKSMRHTITITEYGTIQIIDKRDESKIYSFDINDGIISPKIEQRKANVFGVAHLFIDLIHKTYTDNLNSTKLDYEEEYNLIKIYDKLIYLRDFNYALNIENVYLTDFINFLTGYKSYKPNSKSAPPETGIICEISALSEKLFLLFEKNTCGITRFTSTQSVLETNKISSEISIVPNLITFDKTYKSLLGFGISTTERIEDTFFSAHTSIRKLKLTAKELFEEILKGKFVFRSATACEGDLFQDKRELLRNSKEISDYELIDRTLKGFSNIILWLDEIPITEFQKFIRLDDNSRKLLNFRNKKLTDKEEELHRLKSIIYFKVQESLGNILEYLIKENKINDPKYKELIDNICSYTGIKIIKTQPGKIKLDKTVSQEYIINMLLKNNFENFIDYINRCSHSDFEKVLTMISTEFPEYIIRLIPQNKFINSPRINKLEIVLKRVLDYYDKDKSNYANILLGIYDKRIPTLKSLHDKSRRISRCLELSESLPEIAGEEIFETWKNVIDNNVLILNEKLKLLLCKREELDRTPNNIIDKTLKISKIAMRNILEKEIVHLERKINIEKERQNILRIIEVFLHQDVNDISEDYLKSIAKLSLKLTKESLFPTTVFINKVKEIREANKNNNNVVHLCDKIEANIMTSKSLNVELKRLSGQIRELKAIMEGYRIYRERSNMVGGISRPEEKIKETIIGNHKKIKEYLGEVLYPELYKRIKSFYKDLPEETQQEFLDIINEEINGLYSELGIEKAPSYIELIQEMNIAKKESKYNDLLDKVKTNTTRIMEETKADNITLQELLQTLTSIILDYNALKEETLIEIIREFNFRSITQLTDEEKKQIAININEKFLSDIIIKEFIKQVTENLKNKILKDSILPLKVEYIEKIYKINITLKTYYSFMSSLPEALRLHGDYKLLNDNNSLIMYYDIMQISFKELTMELRKKYGDDVYDPTDGTYGKRSSIKTS